MKYISKNFLLNLIIVAIFLIIPSVHSVASADSSVPITFDDTNGSISASVLSPDGSTLYIGGSFTTVGGQTRNRIAAINTATGHVTSWNPNASSVVISLALSGSTIYVGGYFTNIGGQTRNRIAAIDTTTGLATSWNPNASSVVISLALSGSTIYVGGEFGIIGGQNRNFISAIDTTTGLATSWDPNADNCVYTLVVNGSTIYAGGIFTNIGGQPRTNIVALDATTGLATSWNPNINNSNITFLTLNGSTIYASGSFTTVGGQSHKYIVALDTTTGLATSWDPNADNWVYTLVVNGSTIYAGGYFTSIGGQTRNGIASIDITTGLATSWNPNADTQIFTISTYGSRVYIGGNFTTIGGVSHVGLAAFDNPTSTPPSSLTASNITGHSVDLSWTDNSSNETGFVIDKSTDGINYTNVTTTSANATSYTVPSLSQSTTYYFRVSAISGAGLSAYTTTSAQTIALPIITLIGPSTLDIVVGDTYTDAGATASDPIYGDLTSSIVTTNTVNTGVAGTYSVTYNVTDPSGDAIPVIRTVNVYNSSGPSFSSINITQGTNTLTATGTASDASHSITSVGYQFNHTNSSWTNMTLNSISSGTSGVLDTTFNTGGKGPNYTVSAMALQSDGKIIIGGAFDSYNNTLVSYIARLNSNGTLDTTFNSGGDGADNTVESIAIQSDGKILVGGYFYNYNDIPVVGIARLNSDGTLDTTFNSGGDGADNDIDSIAIQSDGKILVGGGFLNYNGTYTGGVTRLNSDGTLDTTFNSGGAGPDSNVNSIAIQSDGKIIIGGSFYNYNNTPVVGIARLNSDGTLDTTFNSGGTGADNYIASIVIQSDGKILIGGYFYNYNNTPVVGIARLNSDGTLDTTFNTGGVGPAGGVYSIAIQSDGKILIGGGFATYNTITVGKIALLNSDGTLDTTFNTGGAGFYTTNSVYSIVTQSDGNVLIGGLLSKYNGVNITTHCLIRFIGSVSNDKTFSQTISTTGLTAGPNTAYFLITDSAYNSNAGNYYSYNFTLPDVTAPTVSVTVPTDGTHFSLTSLDLTSISSDDVGVASVQFELDGNPVGSAGTTSPYSITIDTSHIAHGSHTIDAVARDTSGNATTSSLINVINDSYPVVPEGGSPLVSYIPPTSSTTIPETTNQTPITTTPIITSPIITSPITTPIAICLPGQAYNSMTGQACSTTTITTTTPTYTFTKPLKLKDDIKHLQIVLNYTLNLNLKVDGISGRNTINAIKAFQKAHNLTPDGVVGPKTRGVLNGVGR